MRSNNFTDNDKIQETIEQEGMDILSSARFRKAGTIPHHKDSSVADHSVRTAERCLRICLWLNRRGIEVSHRDTVRACLLHDIGMTEDRVFESRSWRKAFSHPQTGARIAKKEFDANTEQSNAIARHMWPICVLPPRHRTGWIVLAADKYVSVREAADVLKNRRQVRRFRRKQEEKGL